MPNPAHAWSCRLREAADLPALLGIMAEAIRQRGRFDGLLVNLHHPESSTLRCAFAELPPELQSVASVYQGYTFPASGDDANAQAFTRGEVLILNRQNLADYSGSTALRFERWKMQHLAILPLQSTPDGPAPAGTLMLFSQGRPLSQATLAYAQALIGEATPLIRLHLSISKWEQRASSIRDTEGELLDLLQFVAEISNLTTDNEIYPRIQHELMHRFDLDMAAILMLDKSQLRCVSHQFITQDAPWAAAWRQQAPQIFFDLQAADGATSDVFLRNALLYFGDVPAVRDLPMSAKDRAVLSTLDTLQSFVVAPIRKQNQPIGILWLGSFQRTQALNGEQLALLQHLCDFLGAVIENARTYTLVQRQREDIEALLSATRNRVEVLDNLANRDQLTGLYNFGSFESEVLRRIHGYRQQEAPQPLSIIMCDVDHFKSFNDTHGHVVGNEVLKEIARRISNNVRDNDYVARYGGEEFIILLPRCDVEAAARLAERIRLSVAQTPFLVHGEPLRLSVSLGCAQYAPTFADAADFIARADQALYAAKNNGRNRVMTADAMP